MSVSGGGSEAREYRVVVDPAAVPVDLDSISITADHDATLPEEWHPNPRTGDLSHVFTSAPRDAINAVRIWVGDRQVAHFESVLGTIELAAARLRDLHR
jgi:hypothetical protein